MASFYLDIETEDLDPETSKIISIQYQKLGFSDHAPVGDIVILKSWETSEKDILKRFQRVFDGENGSEWNFVSFGYNLHFEQKFLKARSLACGLEKPIELFSHPSVDLHSIGVLINGGFKGSGLDKMTGKKGTGMLCKAYYEAGDYSRVEAYIKQETKAFTDWLVWLTQKMPKLLTEYRVDML